MNYINKDINEMGSHFRTGEPVYRYDYQRNIINSTNHALLENFFKCAKWVKEHYPKISDTFHTSHDPYFKLDLIVENGIAILAYGSHSAGYEWYLSELGTAYYSQGSMQSVPYLFADTYGFRNDKLEKFLSEWQTIKSLIISRGNVIDSIYNESFIA